MSEVETTAAGAMNDLDLRMVVFALVHKFSPGQPVTLSRADIDAAFAAFPGDAPALRTTSMGDGSITLQVMGATQGQDEIAAFAAKCEGRLQ